MTDRIKREARARAAATGESYTRARRAVAGQPAAAPAVIGPAPLAPYPDEDGVTAEELGWRALPADATPGQRAHAEAVWRPVSLDRPCRCSGPCHHGAACEAEYLGDDGQEVTCAGRLIHADRYPGSLFSVIIWEDVYQCAGCGATASGAVDLPAVPWGEIQPAAPDSAPRATIVYSGVRHPNFPEFDEDTPEHPEGDGHCRACGAYALSGLLCDGCRADGWTDWYGLVEEPDPDDPSYDDGSCRECGAGGAGDPYGECVCYQE
jgi:hypothetical protein